MTASVPFKCVGKNGTRRSGATSEASLLPRLKAKVRDRSGDHRRPRLRVPSDEYGEEGGNLGHHVRPGQRDSLAQRSSATPYINSRERFGRDRVVKLDTGSSVWPIERSLCRPLFSPGE